MDHAKYSVDISRLLARIASGDRQAFSEIVENFQRPLFGFLGRMGLTEALAAEIAQETFLRAWRNLGQYQPDRAEFSTWLFSIAKSLALNELTRASYRREIAMPPEPQAACIQPQPDEQMTRAQSADRLRQALDRLDLSERTAIALIYVRDLPLAEIAALEGTTVGAIKVRVHRAKAKLREWLGVTDD